jgi:putative copper export protein
MLRGDPGLAARVGRRYQLIAWPAFALLIVTGILNVGDAGLQWSTLLVTDAGRTLAVKLALVAVSGAAAAVHALVQAPRDRRAAERRPVASALLGSLSLLSALAAALYGVIIAG